MSSADDTSSVFPHPSKSEAQLNKDVSDIFEGNLEKYFYYPNTNFGNLTINTLNHIVDNLGAQGNSLLRSLKKHLDKENTKVTFRERENYSFVSADTITHFTTEKIAIINIGKKPETINQTIIVARGDPPKLEELNLLECFPGTTEEKKAKLDAYLISHELSHVISFLDAPDKTYDGWIARKRNFLPVLTEMGIVPTLQPSSTPGGKGELRYRLDGKEYSSTQVRESMKKLFDRGGAEEARNLLGTIDGGEVGEFGFLKELDPCCLRVYVDQETPLDACDQALLKEIAGRKGVKLAQPSSLPPAEAMAVHRGMTPGCCCSSIFKRLSFFFGHHSSKEPKKEREIVSVPSPSSSSPSPASGSPASSPISPLPHLLPKKAPCHRRSTLLPCTVILSISLS
jgi:hypothetical protein